MNKMTKSERELVIPGEVLAEGEEYLPGEGTQKKENKIISIRYGLKDEAGGLVRVIPLSGPYVPRRGNVVIGKVESVTMNGWLIDIGSPLSTFLSLNEVPRYVNKNELDSMMDVGDMVVAKIWEANKRGIDLTIKSRGMGKIEEGIVFEVNSNRVPRIIGKEGSMINLIKNKTGCNITVGQNGWVWIRGEKIEDEILARDAIMFINEKPFLSGLTEEIEKWFEEKQKNE